MRPREFFPVVAAALVALALPIVGEAAILTYVTQGRVTQITDPLGLLNFVQLDDVVTYRATFDTATPDLSPMATYGVYQGLASSVSVGDTTFVAEPPGMGIQHPLDDVILTSGIMVARQGLLPNARVTLSLSDPAASHALTDTALPTLPYELSLFPSRYHQITFHAPPEMPGGYQVDLPIVATVDSFIIIPEPGSLLFLAAGSLPLIRKRSC